jgi:hypothetical protein
MPTHNNARAPRRKVFRPMTVEDVPGDISSHLQVFPEITLSTTLAWYALGPEAGEAPHRMRRLAAEWCLHVSNLS